MIFVRDVVDLLTVHERILPLGAVVWASVGKTLGFTPEGVINEIRRTARYTETDFRRIASDPPVDPAATMTRLREILSEAEAFVASMPKDGHVLLPDPSRLGDYQTQAGQRRGHWPASPLIRFLHASPPFSHRPRGAVNSWRAE